MWAQFNSFFEPVIDIDFEFVFDTIHDYTAPASKGMVVPECSNGVVGTQTYIARTHSCTAEIGGSQPTRHADAATATPANRGAAQAQTSCLRSTRAQQYISDSHSHAEEGILLGNARRGTKKQGLGGTRL